MVARAGSGGSASVSRRAFMAALATAVPSFALGGCSLPLIGGRGGPGRAPVALHLYYGPFSVPGGGTPPEDTLLRGILDEFQRANPGITATASSLDNVDSDSLKQIFNPLAAEHGDLFLSLAALPSMDVGNIPVSLTDVVAPIDGYLKRDWELTADTFYPAAIARSTIDGKIVGLPRDIQPDQVVLYNRQLLAQSGIERPPDAWSVDDMVQLTRAIVGANVGKSPASLPFGYVDESPENSLYDFIYLFGGRRSTLPPASPRITLDQPEAIAGAQAYVDLALRYQVAPTPSQRTLAYDADPLVDFMLGNVPLLVAPSSVIGTLHGMQRPLDWDVTMLPVQQGVQGAWYGSGAAVYLARLSRHLDEGWTLAKFLCAGKGMERRAQIGDVHPAARPIAESAAYLADPRPPSRRLFNTIGMQRMIPVDPAGSLARLGIISGPIGPRQPNYTAAANVISNAMDDLLSGKQLVADVLKRATQAGNAGLRS